MNMTTEGLIFEVPEERAQQLTMLRFLRNLREDELFILKGIVGLCLANTDNRTTLRELTNYAALQGKKASFNTLKVKARRLVQLNIFSTHYEPRDKKRPAAVYVLNDISGMIDDSELTVAQEVQPRKNPVKQSVNNTEDLLPGDKDFQITYSRKINHIIMRRCSADEQFLGKRIPIHLPGYNETVHVIQRTASGIPPMDGSEDRLQQAVLTMFKQKLKQECLLKGSQFLKTVKNSFIVDMREICLTMKLKPSSGNIKVQGKKLHQLRFNTFEIHFDPNGLAAKSFNFPTQDQCNEFYKDQDETLYQLFSDSIDQYFLKSLEPLRDEVASQPDHKKNTDLRATRELSNTPANQRYSDVDYLYDPRGRLFRFYRISFHDLVFEECINEALGQIFIQPPSLLADDRMIARHLSYLAQRVFGKTRDHPFEIKWLDLFKELQPLKTDPKPFYQALQKIFDEELALLGETFNADAQQSIKLHGYCFKTICPDRLKRKRGQWRLRIWRDKDHPFTGDDNKAHQHLKELKKMVE